MKTQYTKTTTSLARMATILILASGLMTSAAMAQNRGGGGFAPPGIYTGAETSAGTQDPSTGMRYGNTLVMNSFGEWETYCLTVSLDYATSQFVPNSFIVTGGSWSLVILRDGAYSGTVYGQVSSGNVLVSTNNNGDPIQQTQVNLEATGGLGVFEGREMRGLSGVLNSTTELRSSQVQGNAEFNF